MKVTPAPLRSLQREHALLLLTQPEFSQLVERGKLPLPVRHREHFLKVMRRKNPWKAWIGNGMGTLAVGTVQNGIIVLAPGGLQVVPRRIPDVTLVQAWPKPKALSWILQKAAEIGASQIVLVTSERAARPGEKIERMEAILENACMQSYNLYKPALSLRALADFADFENTKAFFGDINASDKIRNVAVQTGQRVAFVNGPEGGFSAREIDWLRERATGVLLSENVLRSETAAIIALGHLCQNP